MSPSISMARFSKPQTLSYALANGGHLDRRRATPPSEERLQQVREILANQMSPCHNRSSLRRSGQSIIGEGNSEKETTYPEGFNVRTTPCLRVAPAWLRHDRMVLRFYAYFQEPVVERNEENHRFRPCTILFYLDDGTMSVSEKKVENSGLMQGGIVKRHRIPKPDGKGGFFGP